jgi:hypothetical protein
MITMIEDDKIMREVYILHQLGYKIWEIMNLTIGEKNYVLNSYYTSLNPEINDYPKHREIYLEKLKRKNKKVFNGY